MTQTAADSGLNVVTSPVRPGVANPDLGLAIAITAHELRAPLIATRAVVERLLLAPATEDERDALLVESLGELERLVEMTDVLLQWAHGFAPLDVAGTDLVEIAKASVREAQRFAPGRMISFVAPNRLPVDADPVHLRLAIVNLIRNALLYSPAERTVEVVVVADAGSAMVRVRDHGPGIAFEDRPALFEPFAQGSLGRARGNGAGLGLFIARRIVEAHGGTIAAESDGYGTMFRLTIPMTFAVVAP